jgi:MFS family permease
MKQDGDQAGQGSYRPLQLLAGIGQRAALPLLFSGSLVFQTLQIGVYPILITQLMAGNGVDSHRIGVLLAVSWISVLLFGPLVPRMINRFGYSRSNFAATMLTVLAFVIVAVSASLPAIFAASVSMGLGLIVRWIACDTLVVELSRPTARGKTIGLHEALMGLGIGLGPLFFALFELRTIALLAVGLSAAGQIAFHVAGIGRMAHRMAEKAAPAQPFAMRLMAAALAAAFIAGVIENSAIALFPLHMANFGFPLTASAVLVSAFGFGGTLLQPPLGYLSDRRGYAFAQYVCIVAILVSCAAAAMFATSFLVLYPSLFILGAAAGGLNTLAVIEAGSTLDSRQVPAAMTAIAIFYTIGSISGPVASGVVLDLAANRGLLVLFAFAGLALAVTMPLLHGRTGAGAFK